MSDHLHNSISLKWNPEKATLLLAVPRPSVPERVSAWAIGHGFLEKDETHVTLLSFQNGKRVLRGLHGATDRQERLDAIFAAAETLGWQVDGLPDYLELERALPAYVTDGVVQVPDHVRRSIIQVVTLPDLEPFIAGVSAIIGEQIETPLPHVTLFTWSDYAPESRSGIAVNSRADLDRLVRRVV